MEFFLSVAYNTTMENANLIIPKSESNGSLWLGNYKTILDINFLLENNISVVVNCTPDTPYIYDILDQKELKGLSQLETFRIPVQDSLLPHDIYLMEEYYHIALPFVLKKLLKEKKNVVINCWAGAQRSASIVALVLFAIIYNNMLPNEQSLPPNNSDKSKLMRSIIKFIIKKRPRAFSWGMRVNFKESLQKFLGFTF
jgi:protein-tyrosine phosphatase